MGKVFITDEVNDNFTADVTSDGALKTRESFGYFTVNSATATGAIATTAGWLGAVSVQASSNGGHLWLFDVAGGGSANAVGNSASAIARIDLATRGTYPFNLFFNGGLSYRLSGVENNGITIMYR